MNFFRQNPFLGWLLAATAVCTLGALFFIFSAKAGFNEALERFNETAREKNRLERLDPFPNAANLRKMKTHVETYGTGLDKLKAELKTRVLPAEPMAPNDFQARLRTAVTAVTERARANKVKLPDNFYLGFEEYGSALPNTAVAPLLGQQLAQAERAVTLLIDARVMAVTAFKRTPLPEERGAAATPGPSPAVAKKPPGAPTTPAAKIADANTVDVTFLAAPSAARKILNQLAASAQQFYIVRTLHVRNEKDKGPPRVQAAGAGDTPSPGSGAASAPAVSAAAQAAGAKVPGNLNFIVGNEHIEVSAKIEMLRFNL